MTANIVFDNVQAFAVERFRVLVGQTFRIELENPDPAALDWFSNNDQVLSINVAPDAKAAIVKATAEGPCKIKLQVDDTTKLTLNVEVFSNSAASLNPTAGAPVLK